MVTAEVSVRFRDVQQWANDPRGAIRRDNDRRLTNVQAAMTRGCPRRSNLLRASIRKNREPGGRVVSGLVIAGKDGLTDYLRFILDGTAPHEIAARNNRPNPHLRFMVAGVIIYRRRVFHPGTAPDNFVLAALPAALK